MVWFDTGIIKLGDGDGMITGDGTEIKVSIPSHPIPIPFRWEYHPNTLPCKGLGISCYEKDENGQRVSATKSLLLL